MEGIITMVAGLSTPFVLADSPDTCTFLTGSERDLLKKRLEEDCGTAAGKVETNEQFQWKFLRAALLDWKIWFTVMVFWGNTVPVYAFIFIAPTIVYSLGYTAAQAQLMVVPPVSLSSRGGLISYPNSIDHQMMYLLTTTPTIPSMC